MANKTIFAVSTADSELFKDNYRNSFTNHFPHFQESSFNYKMCLSSIDLEKSFKTIGCKDSYFILLNLIYDVQDVQYQTMASQSDQLKYISFTPEDDQFENIISYKDKTIHDYIAFKLTTNEHGAMVWSIVLVLRPGRYHDINDLVSTINHDFNVLGVNHLIDFKYIKREGRAKLVLHKKLLKCVFSTNLFQLLGLRRENLLISNFNIYGLAETEWTNLNVCNILRDPEFKKNLRKARPTLENMKTHPGFSPVRPMIGFEITPGNQYLTSTKLKQNLPSYIKIYCSQLNETIESSKCSRLLAICPGIDKNDSKIYHYQPHTEHFHALADQINQMKFELKNENDELLEFGVGTATYIKLNIIGNKDKHQNMFSVNINSQDQTSKRYYPSNSNTRFTIKLPVILSQGLAKRWTIQMNSLSIPRMDYNVYPEFANIKLILTDKDDENIQERYSINIPSKNYKTLNIFKKTINDAILSELYEDWDDNRVLKFGLKLQDSDDNRLTLFNNVPNKVVSLGCNTIMSYMLGIKSSNTQVNLWDFANLDFQHKEKTLADGYDWIHTNLRSGAPEAVDFPCLPDLNAGKIKHVKIFCNDVAPTFFGGKHEKILAFFNLDSGTTTDDYFFFEFKKPLEVNLNSRYLDSLHFDIITENGDNEILFSSERSSVFMALMITRYDNTV